MRLVFLRGSIVDQTLSFGQAGPGHLGTEGRFEVGQESRNIRDVSASL